MQNEIIIYRLTFCALRFFGGILIFCKTFHRPT